MTQLQMLELDRLAEAADKLHKVVKKFISREQWRHVVRGLEGEESVGFVEIVERLAHSIQSCGVTYSQDGKGDQALVYLHYFKGGADWWITEKDSEAQQLQAFGLADIFGDGGELGYISIEELIKNNVELDFYWTPKTLAEVRKERE